MVTSTIGAAISWTDYEIDGSKVSGSHPDGTVTTMDGRQWYWYSESDTGYGEWVEYKSPNY